MKREHIAAVLAAAGFVFILGAAGASDNNACGLVETVLRCLCGLTMLVGAYAVKTIKED